MKPYNALFRLFFDVQDGAAVTLEKGAVYHVRPEDSFALTGYYCTNTAKKDENPEGRRSAALFLKDRRDITIDGNGATVLVHGKMTPFLFDRCENVTVKNLTVDYACPTMTEFTVESNENGVCDLRFLPECRFRAEGDRLFFRGEDGPDGKPYWEDESNGRYRFAKVWDPASETCREYDKNGLTFTHVRQTGTHTARVTFADKAAAPAPGQTVQTRNIVRDQTGALFRRCKNLRFENLRVKFMHGLGMVAQFCENVGYYGCDFTPGEGRTAASTADFFQFSGCRGQLTVENCKARGAQDDYVNVHGTHLRIVETDPAARTMTVRFMHDETWGIQAFAPGDWLEFIRWDTLLPYAETVVTDYEKINDTDILLRVDRPLPGGLVLNADVVENATWTPDLTVRGCDFGPTWGRGILCTTRGRVLIENNRFFHLSGPALVVEDDCNFWFESGYTRDITFRDNEVTGCNSGGSYGDAAICFSPKILHPTEGEYVHGKLTVTGNVFREAYRGRHLFRLESVAQTEIADNVFDAPPEIVPVRCGRIARHGNQLNGSALPGEDRKPLTVYRDGRYTLGAEDGEPFLTADGKRYRLSCHPCEPCLYITDETGALTAVRNAFDPAAVLEAFSRGETVASLTGREYGPADFCRMVGFAAGQGTITISDAERVFPGPPEGAGPRETKEKPARQPETPGEIPAGQPEAAGEKPARQVPQEDEILTEDPFFTLLAQYPRVFIDYCLVKPASPGRGIEAHRQALADACRRLFSADETDPPFRCDVNEAVGKHIGADAFFGPAGSGGALNYRGAFLDPPHGNRYTDEDFRKVNEALFPHGTDRLEIFQWTTDWSDYFDDGREWWGTLCCTVYDGSADRFAVILASATD